jgi:hypothetical protein
MPYQLRRRGLLRLLASTAALAVASACAPGLQVSGSRTRTPRVALWNSTLDRSGPLAAAFLQTLARLGYTPGTNLSIEWRARDTSFGVAPEIVAQELVALAPDAVVVAGTPTLVALTQATRTIPIITVLPHRSLESLGLAQSLAHQA